MLAGLEGTVRIRVFLKGKFPSGFRHLAESTRDLLEEFRRYGGRHVSFEFVNPLAGLTDTARVRVKDSLAAMGIMPYNVQAQQDATQGTSQQLIFPGALVDYGGHQLAVDLLEPEPGMDPLATLNHSAALLEYKFAHAISQLKGAPPPVAYMLGNGEPLTPEVYDALSVLQANYQLDTLNLSTAAMIPARYAAVLFLKPDTTFTEDEKLKIDQYLMHGGKILWAFSPVNATMDSLQTASSFLAFDRGMNLEDLLFTYGVRVNADLIEDLQCFSVPVTVGHIGNRPQIKRLPWPFEPLFSPMQDHPITRNMNVVLGQFASSVDTTRGGGLSKTVLLASSENSRLAATPTRISLRSLSETPDPRQFTQGRIPVAVLVEGSFPSVFTHRLNADRLARIQLQFHQPYVSRSVPTRMIVVGDGNMFTNAVSREDGPLPMGMDPYTRQLFSNREFFENCLTYLTDTTGIIQARNKDFTLRLLDKQKVARQKLTWQWLGFLIPIAFVLLFAACFQFFRKRRYTETGSPSAR
jgi:gliding-associated putative ABC transporter substrate-binding component GldG